MATRADGHVLFISAGAGANSSQEWTQYQAWLEDGNTPSPPPPRPAPPVQTTIAASAQSLQLANAKSLAAQGRTDEALAALITIVEAQS